jgi:hypothetical protein
MTTSFADVEAAIKTWSLADVVLAHKVGGRVALTVDGVTTVYPAWLAVHQVNLIGVERGV